MNQKLLSKVIATSLAVMLTFTNFIMLGIYAGKTYAISDELENQTTVSNNENVKFDAYFVNDEKTKTHKVKQDIDETAKLYLSINVEKGYLKNAKIEAKGEDGKTANFKMLNTDNDFKLVENIDVENNTVKLKQINGGTQLTLDIPVASIKSELFDLSNFNKINNVKLTGSYVDNNGKTIEIEKTIKIRNEWEKQTKAVLEQETKTYIPYEVGETSGTILQTIIKTGLENNNLPLKQTNINVNVPKVNGKNPEEVIVTLNNVKIDENIKTQTDVQNENDKQIEDTINTEAEKQVKNKKEIYEYDEKTGILNIIVKNDANEEGKVLWNKVGKDEYIVTYKYNDKVEKIEANQKVEVTIEGYSNEKTEVKAENTLNIKENETKGNFVESKIVAENELSKGYLYAKVKKEVEYNEEVELEVVYANLVDKMIIENSVDNFVNTNEELYSTTQNNNKYAYYKKTSINKENFEQILGQDGYIKLIGKDGEEIATFTNKTEADENGNYVYEYEKEVDEVKIETSKPVKEGNLKINNVKAIKGETDYTKKQIEDFQKLQLKTTIKAEYINTNIQQTENIKDITLIAPSTKIDVAVNKNNLSTIVKNENVEFRVILKTNDISCDLYKNPKIELILPNYIRDLTIKDVNLLFEDELKIKGRRTYVNDSGNIVIEVELEGEQSVYSQNEVSKGANLVINTDITLKKLTPTKDDVVKVYVTNEAATSYNGLQNSARRMERASTVEQRAYDEFTLRAVAPTGVVTTTTISGYNKKNETIEAINNETKTGKLDIQSEQKTATVKMDVINNYNNIVNDIIILGRTPQQGNKRAEENTRDLNSNFTLKLKTLIELEGIEADQYTIYYSENGSATKDIELKENGWVTSVENMEKVASYLIVFNNYNLMTGNMIKFKYDIEIPENLEYNMNTYMNYIVYFTNVKVEENIKDEQIASIVGLSTGTGPKLEVTIKADREGNIEEGKLITYTMYVENKGDTAANNVTVIGTVPEGTIYTRFEGESGGEDLVTKLQYKGIKEHSEKIDVISPGKTAMAQYFVEAKNLEEGTSKTIQANAKAVVEGYSMEFNSQPATNQIVEGYLNIDMRISPEYENKREGQSFEYITSIQNINMKPKENVVVTSKVPDGLTFVSATEGGVYNEQTKTVTWNLGTINGQESKSVILRVTVNEMVEGTSKQIILNTMNIKTSERELKTNECKIVLEKPILVVNQTTRTKEATIGDTIEYNVSIQNVGQVDAKSIVVEDYMPDGLTYRGSIYIMDGKEYRSWIGSDKATINIPTIKVGETVDVTIKALVENTEKNQNKERTLTNIVGVSAEGMKSIGSNETTIKIVRKTTRRRPKCNRTNRRNAQNFRTCMERYKW